MMINPQDMTNNKSILQRGIKVIPDATQTLSKGWTRFAYPSFAVSAKGCMVTDADGKQYIDTISGLGPIILGYSYPAVTKAVKEQVTKLMVASTPIHLEVGLAELITETIPSMEMVRFMMNGSDATECAVRLACAYTGKYGIALCQPGYHGTHDWYIAQSERPNGIPPEYKHRINYFPFNDTVILEEILKRHNIGCVIVEQGLDDPRYSFYPSIRALCDKYNAVFVLDEVVTGFRWEMGGAQEVYDIQPDLTCLGKAIANGMPLAVVGGHRDIMQQLEDEKNEVFFSTTFGSFAPSMAAALATIKEIKDKNAIEHIWKMGKIWMDGCKIIINGLKMSDHVRIVGHPPRSVLKFYLDCKESALLRSLFMQDTWQQNFLFGVPIFLSFSHKKSHITRMLQVLKKSLKFLRMAIESGTPDNYLIGRLVDTAFSLRK